MLGIAVDVVPLELGTMFARLNGGDFDLAILQLPEMTEPNVLRHFLEGAFVPPEGANRGRVHDAELDALLDEGDREGDPEARKAIYARVEARETARRCTGSPSGTRTRWSSRARAPAAFVPSAEGRWLGLATLP